MPVPRGGGLPPDPARTPGGEGPGQAAGGSAAGGGGGGGDAGGSGDLLADDASMSFLDHLEALRNVLIHSLIAAAVAAVLCWFWSGPLLDLMVRPLQEDGVYFTAPNEAFIVRLKLAGAMGLFLVLPFILWKIYSFVLPGLYDRERKLATPLLAVTTLLFYAGVAFSFLVITPIVLPFFLGFGTGILQPLIGINQYFGFVAQLSLAFGLIFELPVLVFVLSAMGLIDPRWLLKGWRYALLIIAVISALLTPADVISQLAMAIPVFILYITSVLVAILVTRKRTDDDPADPADADGPQPPDGRGR